MPVPIQNLRSNVANKRPVATGLAAGQFAVNFNETDPAIYLRGHADALVKVAPVYVGTTAPNATPASGGASGNTVGEQWLDKSVSPPIQKIWDGTTWVAAYSLASGTTIQSPIINNATASGGVYTDIALSGSPTAPTQVVGTSGTSIATTAFVGSAINGAAGVTLQGYDADLAAVAALSTTGLINRTGSGTATTVAIGTNANNIVQLDGSARLPAVDGSQLSKPPNPRSVAASSTSGTLTINSATTDLYVAEGLTGSVTLAVPTGSPVDGQKLLIRLKDNSVARSITWTTSSGGFRAIGITLPTTTVAGKTTYVGAVYNSIASRWDAVATVTEA
jgi:hypothetical protein